LSGLLGLLIAIAIVAVPSVIILWVVGKLNLGLEVDFGSAIIPGFMIAIVGGILTFLLSTAGVQLGEGLIGGIIHLIVSFVILMITARYLPGLKITGYIGVLVTSIAIGVFYWLGGLLLGRIFN
jgi:uncharacterized membrane protein YvlD (DUF360 family)